MTPDPVPARRRACSRRSASWCPSGGATPSAASCWRATTSPPSGCEDDVDELAERARSRARRTRGGDPVTAELRYRGQAFELAVDAGDTDPDGLREAFHAAHEECLRLPRPRGRGRARDAAGDGHRARSGRRPGGRGRRRRGRRAGPPHGAPRRRGARGDGAHRRARAGHEDRGPGDRRAPRGDARRPARAGRARSESRRRSGCEKA